MKMWVHGKGLKVISQPAALLAEPLGQPGSDDGGGFGVELADFVPPVVVLGVCEVSIAAFSLAPWGVHRARFDQPGAAIQPANEIVLGRGEIGPPAQIQPNSTGGVELHDGFALGHYHESGWTGRLKGEQRSWSWRGMCVG